LRPVKRKYASGGNFLVQFDFGSRADLQFFTQRVNRPVDQIFLEWLPRQRFASPDRQRNSRSAGSAQPQFIVQRNALEDRAKFVITVGALAQDMEAEIDFRECGDADFAHAAYCGLASCEADFCATRCFTCPSLFSTSATLSLSMSPGNERRHSASDFSHSAAARSVRPVLA
jgi:hypothetical protein